MTADAAMSGSTGAQRRRGPAFLLAGASASEPARWLDQIMAEDRRRAGIDRHSDITPPPVRSRPPLLRAAAGVIGGLCIIIAAQANVASAGGVGNASGIALRSDGGARQAAMVGAEGLFPGDAVERTVAISNRSGAHFDAVVLQTEATTTSVLDSDPIQGLQLSVDACSVPWQKVETRPAPSYSCPGQLSPVLGPRAVIGEPALGTLAARRPGGKDHLRLTVSLPSSADNRFQGQRSRIRFSFKGTEAKGASSTPGAPGLA